MTPFTIAPELTEAPLTESTLPLRVRGADCLPELLGECGLLGLCAKACGLGEVCAANVDAGDDAVVVNADDYFYLSAVTLYGDLGGIAFSFTVCKSLIAIVDAVVIYRQLFKIRSIGEDGAARFIGGGREPAP